MRQSVRGSAGRAPQSAGAVTVILRSRGRSTRMDRVAPEVGNDDVGVSRFLRSSGLPTLVLITCDGRFASTTRSYGTTPCHRARRVLIDSTSFENGQNVVRTAVHIHCDEPLVVDRRVRRGMTNPDDKGERVVRVLGSLDANTVNRFDRLMDDLLSKGADRIVIDLSQVDFFDSSGLRSLISVRARMGSRERFVLRGVSTSTKRILELTGLAEEFGLEQ